MQENSREYITLGSSQFICFIELGSQLEASLFHDDIHFLCHFHVFGL
jgi:hypothetical protein